MTTKPTPLGGFEQRLLGELKTVVERRAANQPAREAARPSRWRRPRVAALASAGALAISAAVGVPLIGGGTTAPASAGFTVEAAADGAVHVTVDYAQFEDPAALQQSLDEQGVPAVVVTRDASADHDPPCADYTSWEEGELGGPNSPVEVVNGETQSAFVLHPDLLPDDGTFVLMVLSTNGDEFGVGAGVAIGDPPAC